MRTLLTLLAFSLALQTCGESQPPPSLTELRANAPILKLKVLADGSILANDQPATLDSLNTRLTELTQANGVVWYYRQNPGEKPHPIVTEVIRLLIDHQLPINLSTQPDFADIIEENSQPPQLPKPGHGPLGLGRGIPPAHTPHFSPHPDLAIRAVQTALLSLYPNPTHDAQPHALPLPIPDTPAPGHTHAHPRPARQTHRRPSRLPKMPLRPDWPPDLTANRIDLIFRPDPDAARNTINIYRILDHEFIIKDVQVVYQP